MKNEMMNHVVPAVEEYKTLRKEIVERIKLQAQLEIFSMTAAGVVWGVAMFGTSNISSLWIGICAGLLILACASLSSYESVAIFRISAYIAAKFESLPNSELSWESFVMAQNKPLSKPCGVKRHRRYYILLMLVNLLIALGRSVMDPKIWRNWTYGAALAALLLVVSFALCFPLQEIKKAYLAKEGQISSWKPFFNKGWSGEKQI